MTTIRPSSRSATNGASTGPTRSAAASWTRTITLRRAGLWLLQRKDEKVGGGLAKTTGWIRRALLKKRGVAMLSGVQYDRIDDAGLSITVDGIPSCSTWIPS